MDATTVWERNFDDVRRIMFRIKIDYKLEENFLMEAENVFHHNFAKYYEKNDKKYLRFFFRCLVNKAKNIYKANVRHSKFVSSVETDDGVVDIYDLINTNSYSVDSELFMAEIEDYAKSRFDEMEYFIYDNLKEGWTLRDISKMLDVKFDVVEEIHDKIKKELRGII